MANLALPKLGDKVKLLGCTSVKLLDEHKLFTYGYFTYNEPETITIENYIGDSLIGTNGKLYPLRKEFDCDFYVIVGSEEKD